VRLAPVGKDGSLTGIRVAMARDGSLARVLGLQTGDVIESIDGRAIDSAATMEIYGRLDDVRRVDLGIKRKGAAQTLTYDLP
jgi:type II secretory pathway component PulC